MATPTEPTPDPAPAQPDDPAAAGAEPKRQAGPGRDPLLISDPALHTQIVNYISGGAFLIDAARAAGVDPSTVRYWLQWGKAIEDKLKDGGQLPGRVGSPARARGEAYLRFYREASRARGTSRASAAVMVASAMKDDWRAAAWYLEHADPKRWGPRVEITLDMRRVQTIAEAEGLDAGELAAEMQRLAGAALSAPGTEPVGEFDERDFAP